jgi:hypothetical protein
VLSGKFRDAWRSVVGPSRRRREGIDRVLAPNDNSPAAVRNPHPELLSNWKKKGCPEFYLLIE